jgi:hypothetical protein
MSGPSWLACGLQGLGHSGNVRARLAGLRPSGFRAQRQCQGPAGWPAAGRPPRGRALPPRRASVAEKPGLAATSCLWRRSRASQPGLAAASCLWRRSRASQPRRVCGKSSSALSGLLRACVRVATWKHGSGGEGAAPGAAAAWRAGGGTAPARLNPEPRTARILEEDADVDEDVAELLKGTDGDEERIREKARLRGLRGLRRLRGAARRGGGAACERPLNPEPPSLWGSGRAC